MICTVIGHWGGSPRKNEACSGYLLSHDRSHLLLDCGSGVASVLQNVAGLNDVNDVILTHYHHDHSSDAGVYTYSRMVNLQIGATERMLRFYGPWDEGAFAALNRDGVSIAVPVDEGSDIDIGPFHCTFKKTKHPKDCLAVKVVCEGKTLVYTSDTAWFTGMEEFAAGADLLIAECSLYPGHDGDTAGHMTSRDVSRLAEAARPEHLLLSHLPVYGDPRILLVDVSAHWDGRVSLASKLMQVDLAGEGSQNVSLHSCVSNR